MADDPRTPPPPASAEALMEELGDYFDRTGSQRIAGRIMGWLLISDPSHQSADEIRDAVQASKGSVSTVTRQLVALGLVERIGLPGDRRTYYRIGDDGWTVMLAAKLRAVHDLRDLAERWHERVGDGTGSARLGAMARMYSFFAQEMDQVLERWRAQRDAGAQRRPSD